MASPRGVHPGRPVHGDRRVDCQRGLSVDPPRTRRQRSRSVLGAFRLLSGHRGVPAHRRSPSRPERSPPDIHGRRGGLYRRVPRFRHCPGGGVVDRRSGRPGNRRLDPQPGVAVDDPAAFPPRPPVHGDRSVGRLGVARRSPRTLGRSDPPRPTVVAMGVLGQRTHRRADPGPSPALRHRVSRPGRRGGLRPGRGPGRHSRDNPAASGCRPGRGVGLWLGYDSGGGRCRRGPLGAPSGAVGHPPGTPSRPEPLPTPIVLVGVSRPILFHHRVYRRHPVQHPPAPGVVAVVAVVRRIRSCGRAGTGRHHQRANRLDRRPVRPPPTVGDRLPGHSRQPDLVVDPGRGRTQLRGHRAARPADAGGGRGLLLRHLCLAGP